MVLKPNLTSSSQICEILVIGCVLLFAAPWTVARQAPLSRNSSGKNTVVGCHFLLQGIFSTKGWNMDGKESAAIWKTWV